MQISSVLLVDGISHRWTPSLNVFFSLQVAALKGALFTSILLIKVSWLAAVRNSHADDG